MNSFRKMMAILTILLILLPFVACKALFPPPKPKVTVAVTPAQVELAFPAILKLPIQFTGAGWSPKEMIVVEMVLPPGLEMKGVKPGEDVGVAYGFADDTGNFKAEVPASTKLNTIFRVGWADKGGSMAPDPKTLNPIPPGVYTIKASGADSGGVATTTMEFVKPGPKK